MNIIYAKSVLYAYSVIPNVISQIDDLVLSRALASMYDVSPADEQCERIIGLTNQKKTLIYLYQVVEEILTKFTENELKHLDYMYFKKRPNTDYEDFDYLSRSYFRFQTVIAEKFADRLERRGITDDWVKDNLLCINFFKELIKRVKEKEVLSNKNKPQKKGGSQGVITPTTTKIIDMCANVTHSQNKAFA